MISSRSAAEREQLEHNRPLSTVFVRRAQLRASQIVIDRVLLGPKPRWS
jgi:hypothetical protein